MRYGIREICDVVFRAKANMTIGSKVFYKDEPVIRFDSLKTSTIEGATTTVYAQGGKGNARLIGWDGEKTVTFTMEDALISTESLAVLTGAGVVEATKDNGKKFAQHITEEAVVGEDGTITVTETVVKADAEHQVYVMETDSYGNVISEPYIYTATDKTLSLTEDTVNARGKDGAGQYTATALTAGTTVLVDYYTEKTSGLQFNIKTESFGGNFYIEGSTLFRNQAGKDDPAEFIIPNGKVQTNFTITMASTGDPSTFTFTVDAFPDYLKAYPAGAKREKVYSSIQVFAETDSTTEVVRTATDAGEDVKF